MHAKYLGIYLNSYDHFCPFDFFTLLSKHSQKILLFTAKFKNKFGSIGPKFWSTLNHVFFTFIYSQVDWNLHILPYHDYYFPQIDKFLRKSQRNFLHIPQFPLSNKAHDSLTGYVSFRDRWQFLLTSFLVKIISRKIVLFIL